jgi:hypothetical protein
MIIKPLKNAYQTNLAIFNGSVCARPQVATENFHNIIKSSGPGVGVALISLGILLK